MSFPELTFPFASLDLARAAQGVVLQETAHRGRPQRRVALAIALVACCDFNIAAEHTRFSCEVFRGSYPDVGWLPLYLQLPMRVIEKLWLMGGWMDAEQLSSSSSCSACCAR